MTAEVSKIQDYAVIGDGRSAALVSKRGILRRCSVKRFASAAKMPRTGSTVLTSGPVKTVINPTLTLMNRDDPGRAPHRKSFTAVIFATPQKLSNQPN
jgi:hypothetical protein